MSRPIRVRRLVRSGPLLLTGCNHLVKLGVRAERARRIVAQQPLKPMPAAPDRQTMGADLLGIAQGIPEPRRDLPGIGADIPHHAPYVAMHLSARRDHVGTRQDRRGKPPRSDVDRSRRSGGSCPGYSPLAVPLSGSKPAARSRRVPQRQPSGPFLKRQVIQNGAISRVGSACGPDRSVRAGNGANVGAPRPSIAQDRKIIQGPAAAATARQAFPSTGFSG
jgi:hypothetical protein